MPTGDRVGRRYLLATAEGRAGPARRYLATDERLDRPVRAWCIETPDGDDDREMLLTLARTLATAPDPVFLRVLDIIPEPERLTVVLESPSEISRRLTLDETAAASADIAHALDVAAEHGLEPERLTTAELVPVGAGGIRLDPIGVYSIDQAAPAPPPATVLVGGLLAALLREAEPADQARVQAFQGLATRWRNGATGAGGLPALIAELRATARESLPAGITDPRRMDVVDPFGDEFEFEMEPTLLLEPWPPAAAAPAPVASLPVAAPAVLSPSRVQEVSAAPRRTAPAPGGIIERLRAVRWAVVVPLAAAVLVIALGSLALATGREPGAEEAAREPASGSAAGPPLEQPAAGRVTVGLAAQERTNLRITIDGVVEFDGALNAGQRQSWEGSQAIQVWTDKGKTLLLAVNGKNLGPYSPAMGHPDWNRIEFTFWPGSP